MCSLPNEVNEGFNLELIKCWLCKLVLAHDLCTFDGVFGSNFRMCWFMSSKRWKIIACTRIDDSQNTLWGTDNFNIHVP